MPELNSIDDFFRRKEQESTVNKDNLVTHWQQMDRLINFSSVPSIPASKRIITKKFMLYAAAVVIIAVTGLILLLPVAKSTDSRGTSSHGNNQIPVTTILSTKDSLPSATVQPIKTANENLHVKIEYKKKNTIQEPTFVSKLEKTRMEVVTVPNPEKSPIDNALTYTSFFKELEKPAEEFTLTSSRDTMIISREGTQLTIPANSFLNASGQLIRGTVKVYLQEFYSFSDIIGNKLTTMSGDKPLATGGMFHIIARSEGEQVKINPQHPLKMVIPTMRFDPFMQLFTGEQPSPVVTIDTMKKELAVGDVLGSAVNPGINWTAAGQEQYSMKNTSTKEITILNLRDNPYHISYGKKVVGRFEIPYDSKLSKEEMKVELEKRYAKWYDVIKVKKEWKPWRKKNRIPTKEDWYETVQVGDSIVVTLHLATRLKMITREDSLAYEAEFKRQYDLAIKQQNARSEWIKIKDSYSFTITDLGWINCDRFINYPNRSLTDFVLNPGTDFNESYLYSVLILRNVNSIMPGQWVSGKIVFPRIPLYENVSVVSIGVKDGKIWACVQPLFVQKQEVKNLKFQETSPEQLKQKLSMFGDVSGTN